jgi:hypothetical protein
MARQGYAAGTALSPLRMWLAWWLGVASVHPFCLWMARLSTANPGGPR